MPFEAPINCRLAISAIAITWSNVTSSPESYVSSASASTYSMPALSKVVILTPDIESPESTSENVKSLDPNTFTVSSDADRVWLPVVGAVFPDDPP